MRSGSAICICASRRPPRSRCAASQGAIYPNATSLVNDPNHAHDCGDVGCLFNVSAESTEHVDLAPALPRVAAAMRARLDALSARFFENADVGVDACPPHALPAGVPCACWMAHHKYGGTLGPFQL